MSTLTAPALHPLRRAIRTGSVSAIFRVTLLSIAQATQAPAMASGPSAPPSGATALP